MRDHWPPGEKPALLLTCTFWPAASFASNGQREGNIQVCPDIRAFTRCAQEWNHGAIQRITSFRHPICRFASLWICVCGAIFQFPGTRCSLLVPTESGRRRQKQGRVGEFDFRDGDLDRRPMSDVIGYAQDSCIIVPAFKSSEFEIPSSPSDSEFIIHIQDTSL
jgi:hypothetical protein